MAAYDSLQNAISLQDLTNVLTEIIMNIRNGDKSYDQLKKELKKLEQYTIDLDNIEQKKGDPVNNLKRAYDMYKDIQHVSLTLRKFLTQFTSNDYDSITYALYYKGVRYEAENINLEWLRLSSSGTLELNLRKAADSLKDDIYSAGQENAKELFTNHYAAFLKVIKGTYRGEIGKKGAAVTLGHVAEAYEEHLSEHHHISDKILRNATDWSPFDKMILALGDNDQVQLAARWSTHEDITESWIHVRHSLGTQRGTVAGDVGQWQVKSIPNAQSSKLRLARFNTLQEGIENYSAILNKNIPANTVAYKIARYLSEPVNKASEKMIDNISDKEIANILREGNEKLSNLPEVMVRLN